MRRLYFRESDAKPDPISKNLKPLLLFLLLLPPSTTGLMAQWQADGVVLCDSNAHNFTYLLPKMCADDEGGAIVCWMDVRSGTDYDIYAQRVDSTGTPQWEYNGKPIAVYASSSQAYPSICSDLCGGAYITWEDGRPGDTYPFIQHVTKRGEILYPQGGIQATTTPGLFLWVAPDHRGGVVLGYSTVRDVCVQRLDSLGNRIWGDSGIMISRRPGDVHAGLVVVESDMEGGMIAAWAEGYYPNFRTYAQRIDSSGKILWAQNGILLSDSTKNIQTTSICSDLKGGAIVDWGNSDGLETVQRLSPNGTRLWSFGGVPLWPSSAGGGQRNTSDARGGSFIGDGKRIHHVDSLGVKVWGDTGAVFIVIPPEAIGVTNSSQAIDGHGGVFNFSEYSSYQWRYVQMQWIDSTGTVRLGPQGRHVTKNIVDPQQFHPGAASDGRGGALVAWEEYRFGSYEIYIARVTTEETVSSVQNVKWGNLPRTPHLEQNYPNPFNPETTLQYYLPEQSYTRIVVYDCLGRTVATLVQAVMSPGFHQVIFKGDKLPTGVYYARLSTSHTSQVKKLLLVR